jgi:hypothetical protein
MSAVESLLSPADALRRRLFDLGGAPVRRLVVDRELRVNLAGLSVVGSSLGMAALAPLWKLALGPIVLGVPHLLSDVRYLIARPGLHRRREVVVAVGLPLLAVSLWPHAWVGLLAALGAMAAARTSTARRMLGLAVLSALYAAAWRWPLAADLATVHLHNLVGVALWWAWRERHGRGHRLVLLAFAAALLWTMSPALPAWLSAHATLSRPATGDDLLGWMGYTAHGLAPDLAVRAVVAFCFAQSVHYGLWLRLVPDDDRARSTPRSFRASYRALVRDLGVPLLVLTALAALGLAVWGTFDLLEAREGYLRASGCHAYLEVAVAALLWAEGRRPAEAHA